MDLLTLIIRAILASTLAIAGLAKILDAGDFRKTLAGLGMPGPLIGAAAGAIPAIEIVVAVLLTSTETVIAGAWAALALFAAFTLVVGVHYFRGRPVECRCFGQLHSAKIGRSTVGRNMAFTGMAAVLVNSPGAAANSSFFAVRMPHSLITAAGAAVLVYAVVALFRQRARPKVSPAPRAATAAPAAAPDIPPSGLPVGAAAPDFELADLHGARRSLKSLLHGRLPVVLIFVSPGCPTCEAILPDVEKWDREFSAGVTITVISAASHAESGGEFSRTTLSHVLFDGLAAGDAYDVQWTPSALVVNPDQTIGSVIANTPEQIQKLIADSGRSGQTANFSS